MVLALPVRDSAIEMSEREAFVDPDRVGVVDDRLLGVPEATVSYTPLQVVVGIVRQQFQRLRHVADALGVVALADAEVAEEIPQVGVPGILLCSRGKVRLGRLYVAKVEVGETALTVGKRQRRFWQRSVGDNAGATTNGPIRGVPVAIIDIVGLCGASDEQCADERKDMDQLHGHPPKVAGWG